VKISFLEKKQKESHISDSSAPEKYIDVQSSNSLISISLKDSDKRPSESEIATDENCTSCWLGAFSFLYS